MQRKELTAEELYNKAFRACGWATADEIKNEQFSHPELSPQEVLLSILKRKIAKEKSAVRLFPMLRNQRQIYIWLNNDAMVSETDRLLQKIDKAFRMEINHRQEERLQKTSELIKTPINELNEMENSARQKLKEEAEADTMTDDEFDSFVEEQCARFSEEDTKTTFRKVAKKQRTTYADELMSIREHLTYTANSMLRAEEYYKKH